ncbi:MAG: choice-of-anchor L domain-containing protein [Bacteroidales bacterium]
MRYPIILLFFVTLTVFAVSRSNAQLLITPGGNPSQMVQNILVGSGVTVSNVTYSGSPNAIGSFTTGATPTNLGFPAGIIMASGNVITALGPNTNTGAGTALGTPGDALLNTLVAPNPTYDAAILEFDFVPLSDTIKFRYVFGSEEYPEYVNSSFNDVFGFFVSGGYDPITWQPFNNRNIAIVPGTTNTPVSINNVNNGTANAGPCMNCAYYINNNGGMYIQYDGITTVLTAWLKVVPCVSYHLKLAVADAGDQILDSGVFLEANSFISNNVQLSTFTTSPGIDTLAIEGCNSAVIRFKLPSATAIPRTVYYSVGGTATNGVDYASITNSIVIPAGSDSALLYIHPVVDSIPEGIETVRIIANTSYCTTDTVWVSIKDYHPLDPVISNDTVLCATSTNLFYTDTLGIGPYTWNWSSGDTTSNISIFPSATTLYTATITDVCQMSHTDSVLVTVSKPVIQTTGDTICVGDVATISATAVGATAYDWNTGDFTPSIDVSPTAMTVYTIIITDTLGCKDTADVIVWVNALPQPAITGDTTICRNDSITISASGGISYEWSTGHLQQDIFVSPAHGTQYSVTVTDQNNCSNSTSMWLDVIQLPTTTIFADSDTICRGASISLHVTGADQYLWNTGSTSPSIIVQPPESEVYWAIGTNTMNGVQCVLADTFELGVKRCNRFYVPNAFTPNDDGQNDAFGPVGLFTGVERFEVFVFDRFGKVVFHTTDPLVLWDGRMPNGEMAPETVYAYRMFIKEAYSEEYEMTGTVTLIR